MHTIDDEDLIRIFSNKGKKHSGYERFFEATSRIVLFVCLFAVVYIIINFYAFQSKIAFWYQSDFKAQPYVDTTNIVQVENTPRTEAPKISLPEVSENHIKIPTLNIDAPITWRVNNTANEVSAALENGVIQINGTSLPGEKGNVYITGHSSNYVWAKGNYNSIFATIDRMVAGDQIYVNFNNTIYVYKARDQKIVLPTDLSVLSGTSDSRLSLVTCWPVGTSLKRLVITADQIYPDPAGNTTPKNIINFSTLTSGR